MAVFVKIDDNKGIDVVRVAIGGPAIHHSTVPQTSPATRLDIDTDLDDRYKAGGDTTWERPAKPADNP